MIENKNITINLATGTVLKIIGVVLILLFVWLVRDILLVVFVSVLFASLVEPLVDFLETKKIPRAVGVILLYLLCVLVILVIMRLLIPPIVQQISNLIVDFPNFWQQLVSNVTEFKDFSASQGFLDNINQGLQGVQQNLMVAAGVIYGLIIAFFRNVFYFFLILVITFYLVVQRDALSKVLKTASPLRYHNYLDDLAKRIQKKIGSWARGQLLLGCIMATLAFLGLLFIMPKYALVLALLVGVAELIPYMGSTLGSIPAVFLGFTIGFGHGLAVIILYIVIQQLEHNLIVPQVMRWQVGINPIITISAMLVGARLLGFVGVLVAVPVAVAIEIIYRDIVDREIDTQAQLTVDKAD